MKFVVLIYSNPESRAIWDGLTADERASGLVLYSSLNEELAASGELVVTEALGEPVESKRVTVREGQTLVTDGPYAEAKELLAGFYLVECESLERAVEIAARVPEAEMGLVEVRPVRTLEDFL